MATTTKLGLNIPIITDGVSATIEAMALDAQTLDDSIVLLSVIEGLISALDSALTIAFESADAGLLETINNNATTINNALASHLSSVTAHASGNISYSGDIAGTNNVRTALNALHNRVESIIAQSSLDPNKDQELVDARHSVYKEVIYDNLKERLDGMDLAPKYFWIEEHEVLEGNDTITFVKPLLSNQELIVVDMTYNVNWFKTLHYTVSGQTLTFLSPMPEDLNFRITNIG